MNSMRSFLVLFSVLSLCMAAHAQCDPTLPRAHLITCLSNQQQNQTGFRPHESQFNRPGSIYQQPQTTHQTPQFNYQQHMQQQSPAYQQPPVQWVPSNQGSTYR